MPDSCSALKIVVPMLFSEQFILLTTPKIKTSLHLQIFCTKQNGLMHAPTPVPQTLKSLGVEGIIQTKLMVDMEASCPLRVLLPDYTASLADLLSSANSKAL